MVYFDLVFQEGLRGFNGGFDHYRGSQKMEVVGRFSPEPVELPGEKKTAEVAYAPGEEKIPGKIKATARFEEGGSTIYTHTFIIEVIDDYPSGSYGGRNLGFLMVPINLNYQPGNTRDFTQQSYHDFIFKGPKDTHVLINKMTYDGTAYGHYHDRGTSDKNAVGEFSDFGEHGRSTFILKGGGTKKWVSYTTYGVSGKVTVEMIFAHKETRIIGQKVINIEVKYDGLVELTDTGNLELIGFSGTDHPMNHFGTPALVNAIISLAEAFAERFKDEPDAAGNTPARLEINDMSLPCGGRFDLNNDFRHPHQTHMFGERVDISYKTQTKKQQEWFRENAVRFFQSVEIHKPPHWHCSMPK